jgi:hypothetical protein
MGPYMALIVPSSFYGINAGLHALSFSLGLLNFLKNDGKMFKYSKRLDDVLIFENQSLRKKRWYVGT